MKTLRLFVLLLVGYLVSTAATGAGQTTNARAQSGPENLAIFDIQDVSASATGINVTIEGQNVQSVMANVEVQDPKTGTNLPVVNSVSIVDIPLAIRNPSGSGVGTVKFPIVVRADPNTTYMLSLFARSTTDPGGMVWGYGKQRLFKGYVPPAPQTFKLEFSSNALNVSVDTSDLETIKAQWQLGKNTVATDANTGAPPKVALGYATLGSTGNELPALVLTLENPNTHEITQEARVTLAVAADQSLKTKVKNGKFRCDGQAKQGKLFVAGSSQVRSRSAPYSLRGSIIDIRS